MEKKSERLEVRLGYQEKQDFSEACEVQGDTPSTAIRRFIKGYVKRSDEDVLSSAWRGSLKRRSWRPLVFIAIFVSIVGAFLGLGNFINLPSDDAIFNARDINKDGELELAEHALPSALGSEPNGVMRVLDLDNSGTISRDEFVAKGRMVFAQSDTNSVIPKSETGSPPLTFVEFHFKADGEVHSGTYHNAIINAGDLDRLVVWYPDGTNSVWESGVHISSTGELKILSDSVTFPSSVKIKTEGEKTTATRK